MAATFARHHVGEAQAARADLRQIVVEPGGEGRVHVDDGALGIDREEAGRRMVEIVDRVLELLEDVLLALALVRDVGDGPERRRAGRSGAASGRTRTRYQPKSLPARRAAARGGSPRSPARPSRAAWARR